MNGEPILQKPVATDGSPLSSKDPFQDPDARHYLVEFWAGTGSTRLKMAAVNDVSAAFAALFVALKHQPEVHTFGVWRINKEAGTVEDTVCYNPLAQIMAACAPHVQTLTGRQITTPPVPIVTPESGMQELEKTVKDLRRKPG